MFQIFSFLNREGQILLFVHNFIATEKKTSKKIENFVKILFILHKFLQSFYFDSKVVNQINKAKLIKHTILNKGLHFQYLQTVEEVLNI